MILDWISDKVFRRGIDPEKEVLVHAVGLMVLLVFMVVITWQDIFNPIPILQTATPTPLP